MAGNVTDFRKLFLGSYLLYSSYSNHYFVIFSFTLSFSCLCFMSVFTKVASVIFKDYVTIRYEFCESVTVKYICVTIIIAINFREIINFDNIADIQTGLLVFHSILK